MWKRFSAARASKMHRQATSDTKKDAQKKQYRKGQLDETLKQKKCTVTTAVKRKRKKPVTHSSSDHPYFLRDRSTDDYTYICHM